MRRDLVVETTEERDMAANICDDQNARVKTIVKIRCEIGNFVSEVDQLRFERRAKIEEVFAEFGMCRARVIARVLDDAFANGRG